MRKCKCGAWVTGYETYAVRVLDAKTKRLKSIICPSCALWNPPKFKDKFNIKRVEKWISVADFFD